MNIFIEGIPGSGKSTFLKKLEKENRSYKAYFEGDMSPVELAWCAYLSSEEYNNLLNKYSNYSEEIKNNTTVEKDGSDYKYIVSYTKFNPNTDEMFGDFERHEIYGGRLSVSEFLRIVRKRFLQYLGNKKLFECSILQNIVDELLLFSDFEEEEIIDFYEELVKNFKFEYFVYYFEPDNVKSVIEKIANERVNESGEKIWLNSVIQYMKNTKYGKKNNFSTSDDLVKYYEKRIKLEKKILKKAFGKRYQILESENL